MKIQRAKLAALSALVVVWPLLLSAQKAGVITKFVQPAFVVQAPARTGLQEVKTEVTGTNTPIKWKDTLRTEVGGRIRAQLTDGSILSIGSKSSLVVTKHDDKTQQSQLELTYGTVRSQVVHLARPDSSFEVRTATAVCGVLGTDDIVDANNVTATVVIVVTGVVTVRSSNPAVVGSVQLTAGQTTTVAAGQPPTPPRPATTTQITGAVNGTTGSVDPDPTISEAPTTLAAGASMVLDGRSSSGGIGSVATYGWSITPSPFVNGVQAPDLAAPVLTLDTTGWAPGNYNGHLTVTNTVGASATVNFPFKITASAIPPPPPDATVTALAQAYETLQVRSFMNLFDPIKYTGYAALEQSITQSFANIQSNRVFVQKASGQTSGLNAIMQVNFSIRFTPKSTALPSPTLVTTTSIPVPVRTVQARRGTAAANPTGSIAGSVGAVQALVQITGPVNINVASGNNSLQYSATNLPDGVYTVTPLRNGFTFTPMTRMVTIANGAPVTGVDFTAQPHELTVNENATMRMELQGDKGWIITDIQGGLGSAGLVGIPGTNFPTATNSPGATGNIGGIGGGGGSFAGVASFTASSDGTYNVLQGGSNTATPAVLTLTPNGGFTGPVTFALVPTPGVTLASGPTTINVPAGATTVSANYVFNVARTVNGPLVAVPYLLTAGDVVQSGFFTLQVLSPVLVVTGGGLTSGSPVQMFAGGSASTSLALTSLPAGFTGPATYTATPNVGGLQATISPGANGVSTLSLTSTDSSTGAAQVVVTATAAGGASVSATVFVNRVAPITSGLLLTPSALTVAPGQPGGVIISVPFASGFNSSVTITPPNIPGLTFTATNPLPNGQGKVVLTSSGQVNYQVSVNAGANTGPTSGAFTLTAGGYSTTLPGSFTINPAFDFTVSPASVTVVQGSSANLNIIVTQVPGTGAGPLPVSLSVSGLQNGITATPTGATTVSGSGAVSYTVSAPANAQLGATSFQVTAAGGSFTHSAQVDVAVASTGTFTISANPQTVSVPEGGTGSVSVSVVPVGSFSGNVAIAPSSTTAQASGPASIAAGQSGQYTVTATAPGSLTFTGTAGVTSQNTSVAVAIVAGFGLTASSGASYAGGTVPITVTLSRLAGFTAPVSITATASGGATFDSPTQLVSGNSATFNVTIPNNATGNSISLSFTGVAQNGKLTVPASSTISLAAPFTLSGSSVAGFAGQSVQITVPVSRSAGFSGTVIITPASGIPGVVVSPASVSVAPGQTQAVFVAAIPAGAASGSITFNGTGGGQTASAVVQVTIGAPFTLSAGSNLGTITPGGAVQATVNIGFTQGFQGPVTLSAAVVGGSAQAGIAPTSLVTAGTAQLTVAAPSGASPGSSAITVTAQSGSFTLTATYTINVAQIPLSITANNKTRVFGQANPNFDATFSGFQGGDTPASLNGALACAAQVTVTSPAGNYPINCAGLSSSKYLISYQPGTLTVTQASSTLALASSVNPANVGQSVTLTATLTPGSPSTGSATGQVRFLDGSNVIGQGTLSGNQATLTITFTSGSHVLSASYAGDANFTGSQSSTITETVGQPSSISISTNTSPSVYRQNATINASVQPSNVSGTVQFKDGGVNLGSPVSISEGGTASYSSTYLSAGTHQITAVYSGDSTFSGATSNTLSYVVTKADTTVAVATSGTPSTFGQSVTLTANVSPTRATGNVSFFDGSTPLGTQNLTSGTAVLSTTALTVGTHTITAVYNGDANYNASPASAPLSQVVNKANSTVAVATSPNPSTFGQTVTLTATITPSGATGTVQFNDNSTETVIGSPATVSNGVATITVSTLSVRTHSISATYSGDANDNGSSTTSNASQVVNKANSTGAVTSTPNPSANGQQVTFTGTVTPTTATGTIQFFDGVNQLSSQIALVSGVAQFSTTGLPSGAHSVTIQYSGDASYNASTSPALTQNVGLTSTTTFVATNLNPANYGASVTFTATVTPGATGTVQFQDGGNNIGTPATLINGQATFTTSSLTGGQHQITGIYSGDSSYLGSTSNTRLESINPLQTTTTLVSNLNPSTYHDQVTFTATVPVGATGSVLFKDGPSSIVGVAVSGGTASLPFTGLTAGTHSITAVYSGDANYQASTSTAVSQVVNQAASNVQLISALNPAPNGQTIQFTATPIPGPGATGSVIFKDGSTTLATVTVSSGTAVYATNTLSGGTHSITAVYSGDTNYTGSTSSPLSQVVGTVTSGTTLTSSANPSTYGQPTTFTVAVTPTTATGSVTLNVDSNAFTTLTLDGTGHASVQVTSLTAGTHSVQAVYAGDVNNATSTSNTVTQTVNKASTTSTVTTNPNPSTTGQNINLAVSVVPAVAGTYATSPNGSFQVFDGSTSIFNGQTNCSCSTLSIGSHSLTATYSGDANFLTSTSAPVTQVVNGQSTTTSLTSLTNPSTYGQTVSYPASVSPAAATGTATLKDGSTTITTNTLTSGAITFPVNSLTAGTHSLTAIYNGDSTYAGSTSAVLMQTVNTAPLTVTANNKSMVQGSAVPTLDASYSGFVLSESSANLAGTLNCTTTATSSSTPGGYPITCSGQTSTNYAINYVAGTLTVNSSTGGSVSAGTPSAAVAGGTSTIPVTLNLTGGAQLDTLSFGMQVTPSNGGPVIAGTLNFSASGLPAPSQVDNGQGQNFISVSWLNLSPPVSGTINLGSVTFPVPSNASTGQTYSVIITGASGSYQGTPVSMSAGGGGTLTISTVSGRKSAATINMTPSAPREGDTVHFRVHVPNDGTARTSVIAIVAGSNTLASQSVDLKASTAADVDLTWTAAPLNSRNRRGSLNLTQDGAVISTLKNFALDKKPTVSTSQSHDRATLTVKNDTCGGVRFSSASQSSCGGSSDMEMSPTITSNGTLDIRLSVSSLDGGFRDLGPMSISAGAAFPDAGSLQPQGVLQQGHTYLVKTGNQLALVTVKRIRSSLNPRFAAQPGTGGKSSAPVNRSSTPGDLLGTVRDQDRTDQLLNNAQITIELEWRLQQ